ncbi:hypothetical protein ACG98H_00930 [Corynebacterium sp. L4756]|uniref:hypothetical protein n=1 Tax=unclassified Corynebacterium TaxID=2624378 RepID=UPI00374DCB9D
MSLFSRQALVAGATAVALTFTGAGIANAQSSFPGSSESTTTEESNNTDISSEDSFVYNLFIGSTNDDGELDPKAFTTWINTINSLLRTMDSFLSIA